MTGAFEDLKQPDKQEFAEETLHTKPCAAQAYFSV